MNISQLENTKQEIILKIKKNTELEEKIQSIIKNNINYLSDDEEIIYINRLETYLDEQIDNITQIELFNFDIPYDKYNITHNNNILNFSVLNFKDIQINDKYFNIIVNNNNIELTITIGLYTIETLLEIINRALTIFNIEFHYCNTTYLISIISNSNFDIIIGENTLFYNLGFIQNLSNSDKYNATRTYDLKLNKFINIYIENINEQKPIMQYSQQQSKIITFKQPIQLDKIIIKFTNSSDIIYNLYLSFQIKIKYISNNLIIPLIL